MVSLSTERVTEDFEKLGRYYNVYNHAIFRAESKVNLRGPLHKPNASERFELGVFTLHRIPRRKEKWMQQRALKSRGVSQGFCCMSVC